jgi:hypothetical protein
MEVPDFVQNLLGRKHAVGNSLLYKNLRAFARQKHDAAEKSESAAATLARKLLGASAAPHGKKQKTTGTTDKGKRQCTADKTKVHPGQ